MESILVFGNGITIDTYKNQFHSIEKVSDRVNFYITYDKSFKSPIFSNKFYPDLVNDIKKANGQDFSITARRYLNKILRLEEHNHYISKKEYWDNIVLFNSFCDYIYKLFWHYHRCSEMRDSSNSGINRFSKLIYEKNKKPIIINLNYDLVIEKHFKINNINFNFFGFNNENDNTVKVFKPHGSINFMSNLNDPENNGFVSSKPFYPFINNNEIRDKNPIWFRCESIPTDKKLGKLIIEEKPVYTVEIVPPGCSNLLREETDRNYIIPWARYIYDSIPTEMNKKKNLIFIGLSFWLEDRWELMQYIKEFINRNESGKVYILRIEKDNRDITEILNKCSIGLKKIIFINGSFTEKYRDIIDLL